jgi:hypothetical protein
MVQNFTQWSGFSAVSRQKHLSGANFKNTIQSASQGTPRFGRATTTNSLKDPELPDSFTPKVSSQPTKPQPASADVQMKLARELSRLLSSEPGNLKVNQDQLLQAIQKGRKLPLPKGYRFEYAVIHPNGQVESPYRRAKALVQAATLQPGKLPDQPQPVLVTVQTPKTKEAMEKFIEQVLKKEFSHSHKNPKSGITANNVVLSDLIEKLISGHTDTGLTDKAREIVLAPLNGKTDGYERLDEMYRVHAPGNPELTRTLNRNTALRQKLIGLDLAHKVYADSQDVEWQSIALSLALGATGEPLINHMFKDGGPAASAARTGLISGLDITGNVLSVFGVVNENLKDRQKKLSFSTLYGPKEKRNLPKELFNPQGEAGPDIKQGIKVGVLGGMLGVLFNIPAGSILSMPEADIASRSVVGGLSGIGSAVAIPTVIKEATESFKVSIRALIDKDLITLPDSVKNDPAKTEQYIQRLALKELNARIGIASSIKATHPVPLAGLGGVILAAEKLGIPRPYVQTAYMAVAPVMHNFIRLGTTGTEKFWTIPQRMNTLEKLVLASETEKDGKFNATHLERMDKAFLSHQDHWLSQGLNNTSQVALTAGVLLAAEVLYFAHAFQKDKQAKAEKERLSANQQPAFKPHHYQYSTMYTTFQPRQTPAPASQNPFNPQFPYEGWNSRNHPMTYQTAPFQQVY